MEAFDVLLADRALAMASPGVYAVFARGGDCLPGLVIPETGLLYIATLPRSSL